MPVINIALDASKIQPGVDEFKKAIEGTGKVTNEFFTSLVKTNAAGVVTSGVITQINTDGTKMVTTFKDIAGAATATGSRVVTSAKAMADEMSRVAVVAGKFAGEQGRSIFPIPPDSSISRIIQYNNSILALQKAVGQAGLTSQQVAAMFTQAANSPAQFAQRIQGLPPQLQAVGQAMLALGNQAQQAGAQGARAGQTFLISWQGLARILEAQLFRRAISGVLDATKSGVSAAIDYEVKLAQVGNVTGQSGDKLSAFGNRVRALSDSFGAPITDVLEASQIALTGQLNDTAAGFNVLNNAMRLSQATGTELAASTKLITSSLQAFRLSGDQAGRVTNVLYNAAQRSRVPLDEMQSAIGRISQTAQGLGVSFEQTTALFLTIAQQGGRPTEAFSLLNQVMGRLLQPTRQLQDFLNGLGYTSAQAGIQSLGLVGFLNKLSEAAARSPEALGDLTGSIRTLRGMMAITGDQTKVFEDNLRNLNKTSVLDGAANVAQTNAQKIRVTFNELKNVFTADIGRDFLAAIVTISDKLGGAKATVATFTEVVKGLIVTFVAYKVILSGQAMYESYIVWTKGATTATATLGTTMSTTAASANLIAAAFTIAFAVGSIYFTNQLRNEAALEEAIRKRIKAIQDATEKQVEANNALGRQQQVEIESEINARNRPATQAIAGRIQQYQREREAAIEVHKASALEFHNANQAVLDGLREQLSRTRQLREEARAGIEASAKSAIDFQQHVRAQGVQETLSLNTDPRDKQRILQQELADNRALIETVLQKSNLTKADIDEVRRLRTENLRLTGEYNQQDFALQRINNRQQGRFVLETRNGQLQFVEYININAANQRRLQLQAESAAMEERITEQLRKQQEEARQRQIVQQLQVRTVEGALRRVEQFNPFDEQGAIARRFFQGGRTPQQAGQEAFNEAQRRSAAALTTIRNTLGPDVNKAGTDTFVRYQEIVRLENERLEAMRGELNASLRLSREQDAQVRNARRITQEVEDAEVSTSNQARLRNQISQDAAQNRGVITRATAPLTPLAGISNAQALGSSTEALNNARAVRQDYAVLRNAIEDADRALRRLQEDQSPENVRAYSAALSTLTQQQSGFVRTLDDTSEAGRRAVADSGLTRQQQDAIRNLPIAELQGMARRLAEAGTDLQAFVAGAQALGASTLTTSQNLTNTIQQGSGLTNIFTSATNAITNPTTGLNAALDATAQRLRDMPSLNLGGAQAQSRASGGPIPGFGYPRGTDTIPTWLSPGEFVVNKHSTDKFYAQLLAINSGHQPQYRSEGGPVNVGDINVSVNGGQTSDKTIREIGLGINRQIRQGRIRWRV